MNHVKLMSISLKNFKGTRDLHIPINGQDLDIYGDNETGKTTIMDAFTWLLFGKDSLNRADFEIKTKKDGEVLHFLEHEVSAVLSVNGNLLNIKKVFTEKWTKRRGSSDKEFSGHETAHFVDDVPRSKREYEDTVAGIADEQTFRLLTNPRFFSESMDWQKRRVALLDICGDVSDADVIASDPKLSDLPEILGSRSLDDHRKILAARRTKINERLSEIPVRISENQKSIGANDADPKSIAARIVVLQNEKSVLERELVTLKTGGAIAAKTNALNVLEGQVQAFRNSEARQLNAWLGEKTRELANLRMELTNLPESGARISDNDLWVHNQTTAIEKLRDQWMAVDSEQFIHEATSTCPMCGQPLPEEQIEAARAKALAAFNEDKSRRMEEIEREGKRRKDAIDAMTIENEKLRTLDTTTKERAEKLRAQIGAIENLIATPPPAKEPSELVAQCNALKSEIAELQLGTHDAEAEILEKINAVSAEITATQNIQAQINGAVDAKARIESLKREERTLAADFEKLEREFFLTEEFIRTKVSMLEEKINSRFQIARFKLFNQQVNGGLSETCEIMHGGVPYWSMNNAARINCGLDVINVLSEHHGLNLPCWIDNAEAVTALLVTNSQQIRLTVSPEDKSLRIEPGKD